TPKSSCSAARGVSSAASSSTKSPDATREKSTGAVCGSSPRWPRRCTWGSKAKVKRQKAKEGETVCTFLIIVDDESNAVLRLHFCLLPFYFCLLIADSTSGTSRRRRRP